MTLIKHKPLRIKAGWAIVSCDGYMVSPVYDTRGGAISYLNEYRYPQYFSIRRIYVQEKKRKLK